jgi:hypothetical protein
LHDTRDVFVFNEGSDEPKKTDTYSCDDCNTHIEVMLHLEYNIGQEHGGLDEVTNRKIRNYNISSRLGDDAHQYYSHLLFHKDKNGNFDSKADKCYFCDVFVDGGATRISDPVCYSFEIMGGEVNVCPTCESLLDINVEPLNTYQLCCDCQTSYIIDHTELDNRERNKSIGLHLCPKCISVDLAKTKNDVSSFGTSSSKYFKFIPDNECELRPVRFRSDICPLCIEYYEVDITESENLLLEKHKRYTQYHVCAKCTPCVKGIDTIDSFNKLFIHHVSRYIFIVFQKTSEWKYSIYKSTKKENELLLTASFEEDSLIDCISIAVEETQKLIYGTQQSFW